MKKLLGLLFIGFLFHNGLSQNYQADFHTYFQSGDTISQLKTLNEWEQADPQDAELFTAYFNYYFSKSKNEMLILAAGDPPKGEQYHTLTDSAGNYAGFIGSQIDYDSSFLIKGLNKITEGIRLYPNRLDMRFGKIYALGQIKDWNSFTKEIIKTVNYSAVNDNAWTWTNNEGKKNGKDFFLGALQDYQMQLYKTMNDDLLKHMREIAQAVLNHYPNHVESLSNLSITFLLEKDFEKALVPLKKAEKAAPKDFIVLNNIAYCYRELNKKDLAIAYYKKVIEHGNPAAIEQAKNEIKKLR